MNPEPKGRRLGEGRSALAKSCRDSEIYYNTGAPRFELHKPTGLLELRFELHRPLAHLTSELKAAGGGAGRMGGRGGVGGRRGAMEAVG